MADLSEVSIAPLSEEQLPLVREALQQALGLVEGSGHRQRIDLLQALKGQFSEDECRALLHALQQPRAATSAEEWHAEYVHRICLALRGQTACRHDFARVLSGLARDPQRDAIVRDYAMQHLRQVWDRADPPLRTAVQDSFRQIVQDRGDLAAAALLSLHLLGTPTGAGASTANPAAGNGTGATGAIQTPAALDALAKRSTVSDPTFELPDAELEPVVRSILSDAPAAKGIALRMTAIRVVADRRLSTFKPDLARILADQEKEHAVVRMASIAAISRFADPADRPLLESTDRSDPKIDRAVRHALAASRP